MSDNKDSFTGTIVGTVKDVRSGQKGRYLRLEFKPNPNAQFPERATAWSIADDVQVIAGDRVSVTGQVSVRKSEKDGKTYIDTSVNFPRVEVLREAGGIEPVQSAGDSWNTPGDFDGGTPF